MGRSEVGDSYKSLGQDDLDAHPSALELIEAFAVFNPHASFRLEGEVLPATVPGWEKWWPGNKLVPGWYTPDSFRDLIAHYVASEGYGADYAYDHDAPDAFSGQNYWPDALGRQRFYDPPERGFEREIRKRLEWWEKLRQERGE